jgi:hypothetical protein
MARRRSVAVPSGSRWRTVVPCNRYHKSRVGGAIPTTWRGSWCRCSGVIPTARGTAFVFGARFRARTCFYAAALEHELCDERAASPVVGGGFVRQRGGSSRNPRPPVDGIWSRVGWGELRGVELPRRVGLPAAAYPRRISRSDSWGDGARTTRDRPAGGRAKAHRFCR